ncbi:MAG: hypothetical protein J7549_11280 [Variovorax sp.]|nr:hypothetical protein [Variovorax sp.]
MDASTAEELNTLEAAAATASRARKIAHDKLVRAFRAQLEGVGPGPSEAQLRSFARLAMAERALQKELRCAGERIGAAECMPAAPDVVQ